MTEQEVWLLLVEILNSDDPGETDLNTEQYIALQVHLENVFDRFKEYKDGLSKAKANRHAGEKFRYRGGVYCITPFGNTTSYKEAYNTALELLPAEHRALVEKQVEKELTHPRYKCQLVTKGSAKI